MVIMIEPLEIDDQSEIHHAGWIINDAIMAINGKTRLYNHGRYPFSTFSRAGEISNTHPFQIGVTALLKTARPVLKNRGSDYKAVEPLGIALILGGAVEQRDFTENETESITRFARKVYDRLDGAMHQYGAGHFYHPSRWLEALYSDPITPLKELIAVKLARLESLVSCGCDDSLDGRRGFSWQDEEHFESTHDTLIDICGYLVLILMDETDVVTAQPVRPTPPPTVLLSEERQMRRARR